MFFTNSENEYTLSQHLMPGGVNSPVRSFNSIDGKPVFIKKACGRKITDVDDNEYIDYCMSWGVHILGHNHPEIKKNVLTALEHGTSYGIASPYETKLAQLIISAVPSVEMVRLVNSGTEAVMSAIRLARAFTQKNIILKFDGCYHGHVDHLLVSAGSGLATFGHSSSKGVPDDFVKYTISVPYNDQNAVADIFTKQGNNIAAVIVEPAAANMGLVLPENNFLSFLRDITKKYNSLLIFDEVITGFRLGYGGAQEKFNIMPDITTLGKIIGGGFPIGAYGGRKDIMKMISPLGPVYQAGTLSGNPIAVAAGTTALEILKDHSIYKQLEEKTSLFAKKLTELLKGKNMTISYISSLFTLFFKTGSVKNFSEIKLCDTQRFGTFYRQMLEKGIYFAPSQFETNFISTAHSETDLQKTIDSITSWAQTMEK